MSLFGKIVHAASSAVSDVGSAASSAVHAVGSAVSTVVNTGENVVSGAVNGAEQVVSNVGSGVLKVGGLALDQFSSVGHTIYNDASSFATTAAHDGLSAFHTFTNGVGSIGGDAFKMASGVGHAIGSGAGAIGGGFIQLVGDGASTAGKVGGDIFHTGSSVAGDLLHGNVGQAVTDTTSGAGNVIGDTAAGAIKMTGDAGHAVAGIGQAAIDGGSSIVSGVLQAGGTALGVAGNLGKDYESTAGSLLTNALDSVTAIAKGEVNVGYGTAAIAASTIGTPVGDAYANIFKGYGDAANATLDHVNSSVGGAVTQATKAGGEIVSSLGNGADKLGHDGAQVVTDASQGNFSGAIHEVGQMGSDTFDAGKNFANAEIDGVKALGAIASAFGTVTGALGEAMGRAGVSLVTSTGETIGGKAGHTIEGVGGDLNKFTDVTADVIQGNYTDAVKDAGKDFGGILGGALGDWVQSEANKLGGKEGGFLGDLIKAGGSFADDGIKDAGKSIGGDIGEAGTDAVKGSGDSSSNANGQSGNANSNTSLIDQGKQWVSDTIDQAKGAVTGFINKVEQNPGSLLDMGATAIGNAAGGSSIGKIGAINLGNRDDVDDDSTTAKPAHATTTSHPSTVSSVGNSAGGALHPAVLTNVADAAHHVQTAMQNAINGILGNAGSFTGDSVGSLLNHHTDPGLSGIVHQIGTAAQNTVNTAASALGDIVHHTDPGVSGIVHLIGTVAQNAVNTAASAAGEAVHHTETSVADVLHQVGAAAQNVVNSASAVASAFHGDSVGSLLQHIGTDVAKIAHQVGAVAANAMQGLSFSNLPQHMLDLAHTAAGGYTGGHDASTDSTVTHQPVPTIEHVAEHFGLPTIPHSEYHMH
jgi:hypothetical protein